MPQLIGPPWQIHPFLSPPVQVARWALMYRFLSVCRL